MTALRLLLTEKCNRSCEGCCNKDWDLDALPHKDQFNLYVDRIDQVLITGGEPMLFPQRIVDVVNDIRDECRPTAWDVEVIIYTAKSVPALNLISMLNWVNGITLTLHTQEDVAGFVELNTYINKLRNMHEYSLRLNVFDEVDISGIDTEPWVVQDNVKWVKDCPLPKNEIFARV